MGNKAERKKSKKIQFRKSFSEDASKRIYSAKEVAEGQRVWELEIPLYTLASLDTIRRKNLNIL